ncbi:hypothetical protein HOD38_02580 [archaeon]|mgnify:FL=1|jgi:hypothetical protein|nr:hypothetical protein [archaeon]MBT4397129.1 hypothetical protein [archaeon]MBT4441565.1 hypothetical protein [archaeon]
MLSPFLKKLLFVRQFAIDKGKIEILGQTQIMLPSNLMAELQLIDHDKVYNIVKTNIHDTMKTYAKKMGSTSSGIVKSSQDIFETFGLGQFQILKLDNSKKIAILNVSNSPMCNGCAKEKSNPCLLEAALDGMFTFLFKADVKVETKPCRMGSTQFIINKR